MATQSIQGLFGGMASPEEMQRQMLEQRAAKFAELTQNQQLSSMGYKGGANLGQGLASAFGVDIQDPTIKKATMLRQLASQYNTNTAKGLRDMAAALQATDPESAFQLTQRAMAMDEAAQKARKEEAEITLKGAQTAKAGFETQEISDKQAAKGARVQMLTEAGLGASEAMGIASNDTAFAKYIETKKVPVPSDYAVQAQKLGFTAKPYLSDYTPDQVKKMEEGVVANKTAVARAGAAVNKPVDVAAIIKEIGTKEDIKGKSEAWKAAGDAYKTQVPMIEKLKEVRNNLPATFTGAFSETALQFGKALSAFGVPIDENKLSNTEYMNSVSSQVLQTIARNFPGSLAVKEMDQLVKSKFSSPQQIKTISRILNDLQVEIESGTKSYEQLAKLPETERYSKDLNLLTGQNYTKLKRYRALEDKGREALKTKQPMTKAEVEEARKLQQELGVQ
jgi:DNA-binding protein